MSNISEVNNHSSEDSLYREFAREFGSSALNEITSEGSTDEITRQLIDQAETQMREQQELHRQREYQQTINQLEVNLPHLETMTLHELQSEYNTLWLHLNTIYDMFDLRYLFKYLLSLQNNKGDTFINVKRDNLGYLYTNKFSIDIFLLFDNLNDLQNNQYQNRIHHLLKVLHKKLKKWKSINNLKHLNNTALQITRDYNSELEESIKKHFDKIKTKITQKNYNKTPNFNETPQFLKFLDTVIEKIDDVNTHPERITEAYSTLINRTGQSTPVPRNTRDTIHIREKLTELYFTLYDILSNVYQHLFLENGLVGSVENLNEMFTKNNLNLDNLSFVNLIIPLYLLTNGINTTLLLDKITFIKEYIDDMVNMLYHEKQNFHTYINRISNAFDKPSRMVPGTVPIIEEHTVSSSSDQSSIDGSSLKSDELLNILKSLDGVDEKLVMDELKKDTKEIIPTKKNKKTKKKKYIKQIPSQVPALEIDDLDAPPPGLNHFTTRTHVKVYLNNYETNKKQPVEGYIFKNLGNNNYEVAISQSNLNAFREINFEDIIQASTKNKIRWNKNYHLFDENNEWNIFSNIYDTLDNYQYFSDMDSDVHKELSLKAGDKISFTSNQTWWIDPSSYDKDNYSLEINPNYLLVIGTVAQDVDSSDLFFAIQNRSELPKVRIKIDSLIVKRNRHQIFVSKGELNEAETRRFRQRNQNTVEQRGYEMGQVIGEELRNQTGIDPILSDLLTRNRIEPQLNQQEMENLERIMEGGKTPKKKKKKKKKKRKKTRKKTRKKKHN
tara:strand:+ start:10 stop:2355 length:2346 start_codon:yes stop_codon:yes gene_type:complete